MKARALLLVYWLILLAATLSAGLWMTRLLRGEQRRIEAERREALQQRARQTADDLALIVEEAREGVLADLLALPSDRLESALQSMAMSHPLVRNVFVWTRENGMSLPSHATGLTSEQAGFLRRYERLFAGAQDWAAETPPDTPADSPRAEARRLRQAGARPMSDAAGTSLGWMPWFWEDQLYLLVWVGLPGHDGRYGAELELSAILSRLAAALPDPGEGRTQALVDANGRVFAQRGAREVTPDMPAAASVSLGRALPHWLLTIHEAPGSAAAGGRALGLTAGAMVGALLLTILSAGSLLLWQARRTAREARQKTTFVSNVSHELKTPLTTIRMYAEMLAEGRVATESNRARYLEVIARESGRLTRLVNQVLDFSRLDQGRQTYRRETLDLAALAREAIARHADRLREAGLTPHLELPDAPAQVHADRDAVEQSLLNLLDNAVKYAASGGRVRIGLMRENGGWALAVADAGPGIPPAQRRKLFQQFHRADDSLTARAPGFGLGLNISRRLIGDQGGTLSFEPPPEGGARFVIRLPAADPAPETRP